MLLIAVIVLALVDVSWQKQNYEDLVKGFTVKLAATKRECGEEVKHPTWGTTDITKILEDPDGKCYVKCMGEKLKVVDAANNVDDGAILQFYQSDMQDIVQSSLQKCKTTEDGKTCDSAFKFITCMLESIEKLVN